MGRWQLLDDPPATGAENMARDEFLLKRLEEPGSLPVLRLYRFDPPAISIGYHQDPVRVLDLEAVHADPVDIVRRFTGGRALLHDNEMTYAVAAPLDSPPFSGSLQGSFLRIAEAVAAGLVRLGVDARVCAGRRLRGSADRTPPCMASPSRHEITVAGRKIVASSQRRTGRAFLQHGSILLGPGSERIARYIPGRWDFLAECTTTVSDEVGGVIDDHALRSALAHTFARHFDIEWEPFTLAETDRSSIALRAERKRVEFEPLTGKGATR